MRCELKKWGYVLDGVIFGDFFIGFDLVEYFCLGFFYVVVDFEFGWNMWFYDLEFFFVEDFSLWGMLELVK